MPTGYEEELANLHLHIHEIRQWDACDVDSPIKEI